MDASLTSSRRWAVNPLPIVSLIVSFVVALALLLILPGLAADIS